MALTSDSSHKRKFALPKDAEYWSFTTLREEPIKIGVREFRRGLYITFKLANVAHLASFADFVRRTVRFSANSALPW